MHEVLVESKHFFDHSLDTTFWAAKFKLAKLEDLFNLRWLLIFLKLFNLFKAYRET